METKGIIVSMTTTRANIEDPAPDTADNEELRAQARMELSSIGYELQDITAKLEELEAERIRYTERLATGRATRDRLIKQVAGFGDPARTIGARAGVSHTWVLKVANQDDTTTTDDETER